jgi:hypothetical protein
MRERTHATANGYGFVRHARTTVASGGGGL